MAAVGAYFLAKKYEPEVRSIIVSELNRQLAVEIRVEDINLSLLQRFPYASLRFSKVVIPQIRAGVPQADTLIFIDNLYLQIGLLDFLRKNYRVSEATVDGGFFDMAIYADGTDNYHFWKASSDSVGARNLAIQNVEIQDFRYLLNQEGKTVLRTYMETAEVSGAFAEARHSVSLSTTALVESYQNGKDQWYANTPITGEMTIDVDTDAGTYKFRSEKLELAKEQYACSGSYVDKPSKLELAFATNGASIERVLQLIPLTSRSTFQRFQVSGTTNLEVKLSSGEQFSLDAQFDKLSGTVKHIEGLGRCQISRANAKIELRDELASIFIDDIDAKIGAGRFNLWGRIIDLSAPSIDLELRGLLELTELQKLFNLTTFQLLEGSISLDGRLKGKFPRDAADKQLETLKRVNFIGQLDLKDCAFQLAGQDQVFDRLNGAIQIKDNTILVEEARGRVNENPFELRGSIENALPYLYSSDQGLFIKALCKADLLDFNRILASSPSAKPGSYTITLPERIGFEIQFRAERLIFRKFEAKSISGTAHYKKQLLTVNPFEFTTASGEMWSNLSMRSAAGGAIDIGIEARVKHIDLSALLYEFEDFGQEIIRSKNIAGMADIDLSFAAKFKNDLSIVPKSITAESKLTVINGKLIDVSSLKEIGVYLRKSPLWRSLIKMDAFEKKLAKIDFDTLRNQISIANEEIRIPQMQINSNALNLGLSGVHGFDNKIDYSFNFRISELLQTGKTADSEFGDVQDDGTGLKLFLRMSGTIDEPVFAIDQERARAKRKAQLEAEKGVFKEVLHKEFGLFGKDTTRTAIPKPDKKKPAFEVEWDAQKTKADSLRQEERKKKPKRVFNPKEKSEEDVLGGDDDL